jgi:polyisoprenoid-binding protein YceI
MSTTIETVELQAGTWDIDAVHSDVSFAVRHMMVSKVRGRFGSFSGTIVTGADFLDSTVTASIDMDSLETGNEQRDGHVTSPDFLDTAQFPTMTYRSTGLRPNGEDYVLEGELTLHGVTRPVSLELEVTGSGPDAYGGTRVGFSATGRINRRDFGIDITLPLDGGVVVADKIEIQLDVQGVLRAE